MTKKQLPIRVEETLIDKLKKLAKDDNRPLSNYIETLLLSHIALQKQKSVGKKIKTTCRNHD